MNVSGKEMTLINRTKISISGRVQGVGCRPFIYRLATEFALSGSVCNDSVGVTIEVQGEQSKIDKFIEFLTDGTKSPALMEIVSCTVGQMEPLNSEEKFQIAPSEETGAPLSQVSPDIATCKQCQGELNDTGDFRYRYPFINCTNCGPRYSIVKTIPYDRCNTTMDEFEMCQLCGEQYAEVHDRRFHAQPVACGACGPGVWLADSKGETIKQGTDDTVAEAASLLSAGKIVAIKGIGGFHLTADATNEDAVKLLRKRKHRDHKPFAMMTGSIEKISEFAEINDESKKLLQSPQAPVVLLDRKTGTAIAPSVAEGTSTFGFMLAYAPLHHLLFGRDGIDVLVMTSANISDEPLICDNEKALEKLSAIAGAFVMHDRDVYRQVDDSVVRVIDGNCAFLRRARGFVPAPVIRKTDSKKHIFAAGADLKNTFCFVKNNQYILSEHIGDLENGDVYRHYTKSVEHLKGLFEIEPEVVACDLHPGYLSTQFAKSLKAEKIIEVQHHWAHIASVLAEYDISEPVIGLAVDGTGLGTDGAIWGCECFIASLKKFKRVGHLEYYPLPGGDKASKEPIRVILGLLYGLFGKEMIEENMALLKTIEPNTTKTNLIVQQLEKGLNVVNSSSAGRLFDAVSALAGMGTCNHFEAQLPMALEAITRKDIKDAYKIEIKQDSNGTSLLDIRSMVVEIIDDVTNGTEPAVISTKFHNGVGNGLFALAEAARKTSGISVVALSGGVFCNRYLSEYLIRLLKKRDFKVLFKTKIPANDGGISLGQAAIAAEIYGNE